MKGKSVLLLGATGLIGSHILKFLKEDEEIEFIKVISRRSVTYQHPKIEVSVIDFQDLEAFKKLFKNIDVVFCAVGTTKKKVNGNKKAYRKVDFDIPVHAAKFSSDAGCSQFVLVSSYGANSKSNNFYLQLKGEVEDEISKLKNINSHFFRPSLLLGNRNEFRFGEKLGALVMKPFAFLFPTSMRPIYAKEVAKAMVACTKEHKNDKDIYEFKDIKNLI